MIDEYEAQRVPGFVSYGGTITQPKAYTSDGIERFATRGAMRWRRPCFSADELADLAAALVAVSDGDPGWEPIP